MLSRYVRFAVVAVNAGKSWACVAERKQPHWWACRAICARGAIQTSIAWEYLLGRRSKCMHKHFFQLKKTFELCRLSPKRAIERQLIVKRVVSRTGRMRFYWNKEKKPKPPKFSSGNRQNSDAPYNGRQEGARSCPAAHDVPHTSSSLSAFHRQYLLRGLLNENRPNSYFPRNFLGHILGSQRPKKKLKKLSTHDIDLNWIHFKIGCNESLQSAALK